MATLAEVVTRVTVMWDHAYVLDWFHFLRMSFLLASRAQGRRASLQSFGSVNGIITGKRPPLHLVAIVFELAESKAISVNVDISGVAAEYFH